MYRFFVITFIVAIMVGCGSSRNFQTSQQGDAGLQTGTLAVSASAANLSPQTQVLPSQIATLTLDVRTPNGDLVTQIASVAYTGNPTTVSLSNIPVGSQHILTIVGLDQSGNEVFDYQAPFLLRSAGLTTQEAVLSPVGSVLSGLVRLQPLLALSDQHAANIRAAELLEPLESLNFELFENVLVYPSAAATGWKITVNGRQYLTEADGSFRIPRPPNGITSLTVSHPSHQGYSTNFAIDDLSPGQRADRVLLLPQPFRGGCGMTPGDEFCSVPLGTKDDNPPISAQAAESSEPVAALTVNECNVLIPRPTEEQILDRGHYPDPTDFNRRGLKIECYSSCEDNNGRGLLSGVHPYFDSTCFQYVRLGCCPNENPASDGEFDAAYPFAVLEFVTLRAVNLFVGSPKTVILSPPVAPQDALTCQDNHKGRECQQLSPGDVSLDFRQAGAPLVKPTSSTPVIQVKRGQRVEFVLHNNGCFGSTTVSAIRRDILGTLTRTYKELTVRETRLAQTPPFPAERRLVSSDPLLANVPTFGTYEGFTPPVSLDVTPSPGFFGGETKTVDHFFTSGNINNSTPCDEYRYFCDVSLVYKAPDNAPSGTRDHFKFSADFCDVSVIFELVDGEIVDPTPSPSPTDTPTPNPTQTPAPNDLINAGPSLTATHIVGTSPCPQQLGEVSVANNTNSPLSIQMTAGNAIFIEPPTNFILPAGVAVTSRAVFFDCSTTNSFTSPVTVTATRTSDGAAETETVDVTVNTQ